MSRTEEGVDRSSARGLAESVRPPNRDAPGQVHAVARHLLGLMTLRGATVAARFALTLFIARYLGLAPLGIYGIIVSATVLAPVLLGFGVANNLGREAIRNSPDAITGRLVQYFAFLIPAYAVLCGILALFSNEPAIWIVLLCLLLFLEHIQMDLFLLMNINGFPYGANLTFFIRAAGWTLIYIPLAIADPALRSLKVMGLFWLAANVLATIIAFAMTWKWRWWRAVRNLSLKNMTLPHKHGSAPLYLNEAANTTFIYLDRYIIGLFLSHEMLGIYTFFWSITNAMNNLIGITLVQTRKGELLQIAHSSSLDSFNRSLRTLSVKSCLMTVGMSAMAIIAMYIAVPYIGRPELLSNMWILYLLCSALVLRSIYEVLHISFYAYNRDDITLYSGLAILFISTILNLALVPIAGIWGACLVSLVSYAIGVASRALIISKGYRLAVQYSGQA